MSSYFDIVWHKWLGRPYRLHCGTDVGVGQTVVLLHGLGRSSKVWHHLIRVLEAKPNRLLAYDLLGFGDSPKPAWKTYNVDDHVDAVVAALRRSRIKQPVVLVGHSMGCLVAVRLARRYPDMVRHLILYEMPLYSGLPDTAHYRLRLNIYYKLYERITQMRPIFSGVGKGRAQRLVEKVVGFTINDDTWRPFVKSLKQTIMKQTTADDLKHVAVPIDVIYGTRDQLVFRGKTRLIFGSDATNITAHSIRESHRISMKASRFLADRIESATVRGHTKREIKAGKQLPLQRRKQPKEDAHA